MECKDEWETALALESSLILPNCFYTWLPAVTPNSVRKALHLLFILHDLMGEYV